MRSDQRFMMRWFPLLAFVLFSLTVDAQLVVTGGLSANQLAQSLVGNGVQVSGAVLNCPAGASGSFNGANANIGLNSGVLLTSGDITNAIGPNDNGGTSTNHFAPGDAQLTQLAGLQTNDACILTFDVVPAGDTLKFRYAFGSEEYPEYVCDQFNDVFAFFISGPGITGQQNIALIPGTTTPVSINTVNHGNPDPFAFCTPPWNAAPVNQQYHVENGDGDCFFAPPPQCSDPTVVQYDGFTVVLTASIAVIPCSTYTLKLAIADGFDGELDSGVFIEAGSLSSNEIDVSTANVNSFESCNDGLITFTSTSPVGDSTYFNYVIGGTATNGIDYVQIADSILFPPGSDSVVLLISAIDDGIIDTGETVIIYITEPCNNVVVDSVVLVLNEPYSPTITPDTVICGTASVQLEVSDGQTFTWTPPGSLNDPTIRDPLASPNSTTTYSVIATQGTCIDTLTTTITIASSNASAGPDATICAGDSVIISASGGSSYSWTPAASLSCDTCSSTIAFPVVNTNYLVAITDTSGCVVIDTVTVFVDNSLTLNLVSDTTICSGDSVQITAGGGINVTWSPATGLSCTNCPSPWISPSDTTTYTVIVSGGTCADTGTITVNLIPTVSINAISDTFTCPGDSVTLFVLGANAPNWFGSDGSSCNNCPSFDVGPLVPTTYIVTDQVGVCLARDTILVDIYPLPLADAGLDTSVCPGDTVQLNANAGGSVSWSPSSTLSCDTCLDPLAFPLDTTDYILTVTSANACISYDTMTVVVVSTLVTGVTADTSICAGDSVALLASGGSQYIWSPANGLSCTNCPDPSASPADTTTYQVIILAGQCTDTQFVTVDVIPVPVPVMSADTAVCPGFGAMISVSGAGNISWSPSADLSCTNCPDPVASPSATSTYIATLDNFGCTASDSVTVQLFTPPTANAGLDQTMCVLDSVTLNGSGGQSYSWSPIAGLSDPTIANPVAQPPLTTDYILTVTDINGCTDTDTVTVDVIQSVSVSVNQGTTICAGDSYQLNATGGNNYTWFPTTDLNCINCSDPIATPDTTTTFNVVTSFGSCRDTASVTITVIPPVAADAGADTTICQGDTIQLQGSGGNTFSWSPANGLSNTTIADPLAGPSITTTYTLTGSVGACSDQDQMTVFVVPAPSVSVLGNIDLCQGDSVQLQVFSNSGGNLTYAWNPDTALSCKNCPNPIANPTGDATYSVTVTNSTGCSVSRQINITISEFEINASPDDTIWQGTQTAVWVIDTDPFYTYAWVPDTAISNSTADTTIVYPGASTTYEVTATNLFGCTASDTVRITVIPPGSIYVPNAFTPNGDGNNDVFFVYGNDVDLERIMVFDRWGQKVFESSSFEIGWDGTINGKEAKPGVYVWVVEYRRVTEFIFETGSLHIVK